MSPTNANSSVAEPWSILTDDLLSISYLRLTTPTASTSLPCARLGHLPCSLLPWLIFDLSGARETNRVYCPEEGVVRPRLSLPGEAVRRCFMGSHDGGWVASSEAPYKIINFFSGAEVALSPHTRPPRTGDPLALRKIILSEQPILSTCIIAAITRMHELVVYNVGCPEAGWTIQQLRGNDRLMDIAFCNGELYGTTQDPKDLIKFGFVINKPDASVHVKIHCWFCMLDDYREGLEHVRYIVDLRGELLMVVRGHRRWSSFKAFRLVHANIGMNNYKWVEAYSLGVYALFLGPTCSKAVQVPASGHRDMQKNHIYFSHHRCLRRNNEIPNGAKVYLTSLNDDGYRVYYKEDECFMSTGYYVIGAVCSPMWTFPLDI